MKEKVRHAEIKRLLPGFGLNALSVEERTLVLRHLEGGCHECNRLISEYELVTGALALECQPKAPPAFVKQNILSQISARPGVDQKQPAAEIVRAGSRAWEPLFPGIEIKSLFQDPETGYRTALVRMASGSRLPRHVHRGEEATFVVEGSCVSNDIHFAEGDFWHVESGYVDEPTDTETGCVLFVRFLEVEFYP
ncbi:MAG: cupin domain-containing protein [bacterium]